MSRWDAASTAAATTTSTGLVELATTAETTTGTDTARAVTPAGLKAVADTKADATATTNALATKADLVGGVVPTSQLPPLAINDVSVVATQAAMLALTAQRGDMAIRSDNGRTYVLATDSPTTLADWKEVQAAGQVASVAGKTGVIVLAAIDISDSSATGRSLLTAADAAAARTAISAASTTLATASAAGIVELATTAEALAGTDTARAVTAAGVKAVADGKMPLNSSLIVIQATAAFTWPSRTSQVPTGFTGIVHWYHTLYGPCPKENRPTDMAPGDEVIDVTPALEGP